MNPARKQTRDWLKRITIPEYMDISSIANLSPPEREVSDLIYIGHKDERYIADTIGYTERGVQDIHARALDKFSRAFGVDFLHIK